MDSSQFKIIETFLLVASIIGLRFLIFNILYKVAKSFNFESRRKKMIAKIMNFLLFLLALIILLGIWGIDKSRLVLYFSSILAVLGVAFVAQWSHLSNITATVILFFSHPVRIGDHIIIKDKDIPVEGRISDIGLFFVTIKNEENEKILMSSTLFLQKIVLVAEQKEKKEN